MEKEDGFKTEYIFAILFLLGFLGVFAGGIIAIWAGFVGVKIIMTSIVCILTGYFGIQILK